MSCSSWGHCAPDEPALLCGQVNVNTTDATAGVTALLLPAQNTHTLHDPKRDTEHARAGGVEDGLGVGGLDGGGDKYGLATVILNS